MRQTKDSQFSVCSSDRNGRILNSDHYGRSFRLLAFRQAIGVRRLSALSQLNVGESGVLVALDLPESVQNHLMHMGFVPGALVTALRRAPAGDPTIYGVDGMEIALRHETAEAMRVEPPDVQDANGREAIAEVPDVEAPDAEAPELIEAVQ
jgi:Fe2+ transport system protein FeoA